MGLQKYTHSMLVATAGLLLLGATPSARAQQAAPSGGPQGRALAVLSDSVSAVARAYLAAFGDTARFLSFYDQSTDFIDVEQGRLKTWAMHEADIRGFFTRARHLSAVWENEPRVVMLSSGGATVAGIARYRFTMPDGRQFDNRQATTLVFRRTGARWQIVQQHGSPADK